MSYWAYAGIALLGLLAVLFPLAGGFYRLVDAPSMRLADRISIWLARRKNDGGLTGHHCLKKVWTGAVHANPTRQAKQGVSGLGINGSDAAGSPGTPRRPVPNPAANCNRGDGWVSIRGITGRRAPCATRIQLGEPPLKCPRRQRRGNGTRLLRRDAPASGRPVTG